ncbi:hypothetical protein MASR2M47_39580 [Draconibacterium sp.]
MENKKVLNYLLNDLSELGELFAEKGKNSFDEFEMEFIQNRISGSIRLVKLFLEKEKIEPAEIQTEVAPPQKQEQPIAETSINKIETKAEENIQENPAVKTPEVWVEEKVLELVSQKVKTAETYNVEKVVVVENNITAPEIVQAKEMEPVEDEVVEMPKETVQSNIDAMQKELQLEDDEPVEMHNKRLGDSFFKEKSVNDLRSDDLSKLEHKLSNRPVSSIQSAIGINDRFQYVRELFEGSTENFVKAVTDLDSMKDMKEAVDYLQANFKWKKNESSLKFVNLIKRRFPNE